MGGFFGVASKEDCMFDLFFGTDYHSHLGTRRAGMAVYDPAKGFDRAIHNIENSPFRTKFDKDVASMKGGLGIGCISDYEPPPPIVRSHHGTYAIVTVGKINNTNEIVEQLFKSGHSHFLEMSGGDVNATELVASVINQKQNLIEGIQYAQEVIDGSMTMLIMTPKGILAARDKLGRTPVALGQKENAYCISFESFAYLNLGYTSLRELGPGEIAIVTPEGVKTLVEPGKDMKICTFLWVYYGYPSSSYEGVSVEQMRYHCGAMLARRDDAHPDTVAGVPDSGIPHAIGYSTESKMPFGRPFIKYTPTWPRSFMPANQDLRNKIANMKQVPVPELIRDKKLLFVDDSIVRGTQLRETVNFLYDSGAAEVHMRSACPPIMYSCKYLSFSSSKSDMDLIARRVVDQLEGEEGVAHLDEYADARTERGQCLLKTICEDMGFDSLSYQSLQGMIEAIGIDPEKICTYCWDGRE
mgnify:CR=1 FL=1